YRGTTVPVIGGASMAMALVVAHLSAYALGTEAARTEVGLGISILALGFFFLGLVDDFTVHAGPKGFRGHLLALTKGRVTTGLMKAAGGFSLSFAVAWYWRGQPAVALLDAVVIALAANLINLLDLRPGRAVKAYLAGWTAVAAAGWGAPFVTISAAVTGAAAGWLPSDLWERGVLGDSGSNLLGAVLGAAAVLALDIGGRSVVALGLVVLTLLSERFSFTAAIDAAPPLRWLDRLGRQPDPQ
ncbi:MAG: hypothetical protein ACRDIU_07560, partial [Actinomycetota bacterium]